MFVCLFLFNLNSQSGGIFDKDHLQLCTIYLCALYYLLDFGVLGTLKIGIE